MREPLGSGGLAAATAISSYLQVAMLVVALRRRLGPGVLAGLRRALRDTTIATVAMAVAVIGAGHLTSRYTELVGLVLAVVTECLGFFLREEFLLVFEILGGLVLLSFLPVFVRPRPIAQT